MPKLVWMCVCTQTWIICSSKMEHCMYIWYDRLFWRCTPIQYIQFLSITMLRNTVIFKSSYSSSSFLLNSFPLPHAVAEKEKADYERYQSAERLRLGEELRQHSPQPVGRPNDVRAMALCEGTIYVFYSPSPSPYLPAFISSSPFLHH